MSIANIFTVTELETARQLFVYCLGVSVVLNIYWSLGDWIKEKYKNE